MPACPYGSKCYRKNPEHIAEFHSNKLSKNVAEQKAPETKNDKKTNKAVGIGKFFNKTEKAPMKRKEGIESEQQTSKRSKENLSPKKQEPSTSKESIREPLHPIPKQVKQFWEHAKVLNEQNPLSAFSSLSSLTLVGPFEWQDEKLDSLTEDEIRLHHRYANDLPEMQTIGIYEKGRFALWRDEPDSSECLIVHVATVGKNAEEEMQHFPNIEIVGDHPAYMIVHLSKNSPKLAEKLLPKNMEIDGMKSYLKTVISDRKKKAIGRPLHGACGPRICVKVVNDVGYRPVPEEPTKLKKTLTLIGSTDDEDLKEAKMKGVREIVTYIQFANDECDFGMGLEFGHDVFLANYPVFDRMSKMLLLGAYGLLNRNEFKEIVRVQFEDGNRRRDNYSKLK